jgi:4-hydroxy-tetrahydrodipicolinate synthase
MALTRDLLKGTMPPLPTPFSQSGDLDEEKWRALIRWYLDKGIDGIMLGGSTGEGASLTTEESTTLIRAAREENQKGLPVVAGVIADDTRGALRMGHAAKEAGADGLLVTPIHYAVPSEDGMVAYFESIAQDVGLPIIIYNVIPRALINVDLMERLADIELVIGIKEGMAGIEQTGEMVRRMGDRISIMSNYDRMLFSAYVLGVHGTIGAIATIATELSIELYHLVQEGSIEAARQIHFRLFPVADYVFGPGYIEKIKAALYMQGCDCGYPRSPLLPVDEEVTRHLKGLLEQAGII